MILGSEEAVANGGLGVGRIAELAGREKSQISRALRQVAAVGLIERDPSSQAYRLGWRMFTLAQRAGDARLRLVAPRVLEDLVLRLGETAHLSVLSGTEVLTVFSEASPSAVRTAGWVGRRVPAWCTASGRALLFDASDDEVRSTFAGVTFSARGPKSPSSLADMLERLDEARRAGVAVNDEEFEKGLLGLGAPVRDATGRIVAAVNVSGPKFRLIGRRDDAVEAVVDAGTRLAAALGFSTAAHEEMNETKEMTSR